ncbi:MAG: hypothetical protein QM639_11985, partial [Rhodocyclaceae bacterium]
PLGTRVPGLDSTALPGGRYAVMRVAGSMHAPAFDSLGEAVERQCGVRLTDGPVLRSFQNATYLPSALERCFDLYLPVA